MAEILIIDSGGIYFEFAKKLYSEGHEVYYYCTWQTSYPKIREAITGLGFGPIKVYSFDILDKVDLVCFPDIGWFGFSDYLREQGIECWGGGSKIEWLENDRVEAKKIFDEVGIPHPESKFFTGTEELRSYLKRWFSSNPDQPIVVKINLWRGDFESQVFYSWDEADLRLIQFEGEQAGIRDYFTFIVEKFNPGVEIGIDTWVTSDGKHSDPYFFTLENHENGATVGRWVSHSIWDKTLDKLGKIIKQYKYFGPISLEGFYQKETGDDILITDVTARFPAPGFCIFMDTIKDFGKFILQAENKIKIIGDEYAACGNLMLDTDYMSKWEMFTHEKDFPACYRRTILRNKQLIHLPGSELALTVTQTGKTPQEALTKVMAELAKAKISGSYFEHGLIEGFDDFGLLNM